MKTQRMKTTTIRLPADLLARAKIHAVLAETTFQQLVIDGLDVQLSRRPALEEAAAIERSRE